MRPRAILIALLLVVPLAAMCMRRGGAPERPADPTTLRRAIEAELDSTRAISARRDYAAFARRVPEDLVIVPTRGVPVGRDSLLARMRRRWDAGMETGDLRIVVDSLHPEPGRDDAVTVFTTQRFARRVPGAEGRTHEVVTSVTHRERWERREGRWVGVRIEELAQGPTLVDGVEQPRRP